MNNNTYSQLRNELSILYPGFTDIELNEMTENLLSFYKIAVKAVLEQKKPRKINKLNNNFDI